MTEWLTHEGLDLIRLFFLNINRSLFSGQWSPVWKVIPSWFCLSSGRLSRCCPLAQLALTGHLSSPVQSLSHVWLFATPGLQYSRPPCPSPTPGAYSNMSVESVMPSTHLILCRPLLPSVIPRIRVFSNESVLCIRWPEDWGFGFSISPSNEYSGLISFRTDWLDLLAVQGTLKSLL